MNKKRIFLHLVFISIGFLLVTQSVLAATRTWNGTVGGVDVTAEKYVDISGGYLWYTDLICC